MSPKFLWLVVVISFICIANARQIRYSRYNTEVLEGREISNANQTENNPPNEVKATVREIKLAPYPASGYRPSKAFPLPNESGVTTDDSDANVPVTDEIPAATTTTPVNESDINVTSAPVVDEAENPNQNYNNSDDSVYVEAGEDVMTENQVLQAPYPAAGFQPRIPFLLPTADLGENKQDTDTTDLAITEMPEETTTVLPLETETKRGFPIRLPVIAVGRNLLNILFKDQPQPQENEENVTELSITEMPEENTTELPLDMEIKAPYPAAGYRPSQPFLLPNEQLTLAKTETKTEEDDAKQAAPPKEDNSKHPVCGSSTNPLAPKPIDGEKEDPDSESIFLNGQIQRNQQIINLPVRFTVQPVQPLLISRPFVYTAHLQTW